MYRSLWRWHFYASLFCMPFVVVLATSGALYLFKPQFDALRDAPYENLSLAGERAGAGQQAQAAVAAIPGATFSAYELPRSDRSAAQVMVRQKGEAYRVYVHPQSLAVLHSLREDGQLMRWMHRLHGELLIGDFGSHLVELAACWTIVMILTGIALWWPRQSSRLGGVLYPRLLRGSKVFWRDVHSVTGVWISCLAIFLLVTGLPWAKFWGGYFKTIRAATGTASAKQDWATGSQRAVNRGQQGEGASADAHAEHGGGHAGRQKSAFDLAQLDRVVAAAGSLGLEYPVIVSPGENGQWAVRSMTQNRPHRASLVMRGDGSIVSRENFSDRHPIDRAVSVGIAAHEGQLFGWTNQLLGLITAGGLVLLCVSGVVMWIRRRPSGELGAPRPLPARKFSLPLLAIVLLLAIYLPLFGATLLAVLVIERLALRRIPRVSEWLGLARDSSPAPRANRRRFGRLSTER